MIDRSAAAARGGPRWLALGTCLVAFASAPAVAGDSGPADGCARGSEQESFWQRLSDSYKSHLFPTDAPAPEPNAPPAPPTGYDPDRGPAPPESSSTWPYSTWPMGGTAVIGYENITYGPLMDAIWCGKNGKSDKDSRWTVYGWLEPGGNISTSDTTFNKVTGTGGNYPAAYSYQPDKVQLDQLAVYVERTPDEVQKDHFDWGFRFTGLYGTDYKYTFSDGILSNQYTEKEKLYGFDPVMYYLDLYFPRVFDGMNVRIGRYISIPDIEAQLAPNNITYSHSLLYTYDPYTQNGIVATVKLDRNWTIQAEVSGGNDVGPWAPGHQFRATPALCVDWTSNSGNDVIYPCMNGLNDSDWRWNNVQHAVTTWYHKFNDKWHTDTEVWYMWQAHTPNVNNPAGVAAIAAAFPAPQFNIGAPDGAQCNPGVVYCYSYEWAVLNYINYTYTEHQIFTWRTDFLNDAQGQRTGFKSRYAEFALGYTHWVGDALELRPELRFDHALDAEAYDNPTATPDGGKKNQLMLAADMILHF